MKKINMNTADINSVKTIACIESSILQSLEQQRLYAVGRGDLNVKHLKCHLAALKRCIRDVNKRINELESKNEKENND